MNASTDTTNFLSAERLHLREPAYLTLIDVLGKLERGELKHRRDAGRFPDAQNYFTMNEPITKAAAHCGTAGCIGGWMYLLMHPEMSPFEWVEEIDVRRKLAANNACVHHMHDRDWVNPAYAFITNDSKFRDELVVSTYSDLDDGPHPIYDLFWPNSSNLLNSIDYEEITTAEAASAIRYYLTTGEVNWDVTLADNEDALYSA